MKRVTFTILLWLIACAGVAAEPTIDDAQQAYLERDYAKSFAILKELAATGDARAQFNLANMHRQGLGTNRSSEEGFRWMRRSASKGHAPAQTALGQMFKIGEGTTQDYNEAIRWLTEGNENGEISAGLWLGKIYLEGTGVPKDQDKATKIFEQTLAKVTEANFSLHPTSEILSTLAKLSAKSTDQQAKAYPLVDRLISAARATQANPPSERLSQLAKNENSALERQLFELNQQKDKLQAELERAKAEKTNLVISTEAQNQANKNLMIEIEKKNTLIKEIEKLRIENEQLAQPKKIYDQRTVHALVIGNASYPGAASLKNPVNDAKLIADKFRTLNFKVSTVTNANRSTLVKALSDFSSTSVGTDIGIIYYAGHGIQVGGINYILPVDIELTDLSQVTLQGISLNTVMEQYIPGNTKIAFLDACREHPASRTTTRGFSRGLAPISASEGTLISYATKDGGIAFDGEGTLNSPFTESLVKFLSDPEDIAVVLRRVRDDVLKKTKGQQQPWEYGSLTGGSLVLSRIQPK